MTPQEYRKSHAQPTDPAQASKYLFTAKDWPDLMAWMHKTNTQWRGGNKFDLEEVFVGDASNCLFLDENDRLVRFCTEGYPEEIMLEKMSSWIDNFAIASPSKPNLPITPSIFDPERPMAPPPDLDF